MEVKHLQIEVQLHTTQLNLNMYMLIQTYRDGVKMSTKKPSVITCFIYFGLFVSYSGAHLQNSFVGA